MEQEAFLAGLEKLLSIIDENARLKPEVNKLRQEFLIFQSKYMEHSLQHRKEILSEIDNKYGKHFEEIRDHLSLLAKNEMENDLDTQRQRSEHRICFKAVNRVSIFLTKNPTLIYIIILGFFAKMGVNVYELLKGFSLLDFLGK